MGSRLRNQSSEKTTGSGTFRGSRPGGRSAQGKINAQSRKTAKTGQSAGSPYIRGLSSSKDSGTSRTSNQVGKAPGSTEDQEAWAIPHRATPQGDRVAAGAVQIVKIYDTVGAPGDMPRGHCDRARRQHSGRGRTQIQPDIRQGVGLGDLAPPPWLWGSGGPDTQTCHSVP